MARHARNPARRRAPRRSASDVFTRLATLYTRMQDAYDNAARPLNFTCADCAENCCISYFQHHTHVEWAYFMEGVRALPDVAREALTERARRNVQACEEALTRGERPRVMCPANEDGLCQMYDHRFMICRLHGVAHVLRAPDGRVMHYPGCPRFEALTQDQPQLPGMPGARGPVLDRTPLYRELAAIEMAYLGPGRRGLPKVDLTLSEMVVRGAPFGDAD